MREKHGVTGRLCIVASDAATGRVVAVRRADNLVTTEGRQLLGLLLAGKVRVSAPAIKVRLGTGTRAPAPSDTALENQWRSVAARAVEPREIAEGDLPRMLVEVTAELPADADAAPDAPAVAISEAGIELTTDARTVLYNRVVFAPIGRGARLDLKLSWEVLF
jgi:hypothetical protein